MDSSRRVVESKLPAHVVAGAVFIAMAVAAFIILAVWESGRGLKEARMSGVVIAKEFRPLAQTERQITLNRSGTVTNALTEGDFILHVEVPQKDGKPKLFNVWLNDRQRYDAVKVGDNFDVGPYVVPSN